MAWFPLFPSRQTSSQGRLFNTNSGNSRRRLRRPSGSLLRHEQLEGRALLAADIISVTSTLPSGNYTVGQVIPIAVEYSEPVFVAGSPVLSVNANPGRLATYVGQSGGGHILNFAYSVQPGDSTIDFDVSLAPANAVLLGTITSQVDLTPADRNVANVLGVDPSITFFRNIAIDTTAPARPTVQPLRVNPALLLTPAYPAQLAPDYFTLRGTSGTGAQLPADETMYLTVNGATYDLTPLVQVDGTWAIHLPTATPVVGFPLNPWSNTNVANYSCLVEVFDTAGNRTIDRSINEITIDTVAPTVRGVSSPNADGIYTVGDVIFIDVEFNEEMRVVTQQGTPVLLLNANAPNAIATFSAVLPTNPRVVRFAYTVRPGDSATDLDYVYAAGATTAIVEQGGRIHDLAGNQAILDMTTPAGVDPSVNGTGSSLGWAKNIQVDTVAPTVTNVASPLGITGGAPFFAVAGDTIPISIFVDSEVVVTGLPRLRMLVVDRNNAEVTRYAEYAGNVVTGVGAARVSELRFTYTVQPGDNAWNTNRLTYRNRSALEVGGGTIQDVAGNDLVLQLPARFTAGSLGFNNDIRLLSSPVVTSVSADPSTPDRIYTEGDVIRINVRFDKPVTVSGTPTLRLNSAVPNAIARFAGYGVGGTGTAPNNVLSFTFLVRPGDTTVAAPLGELDYSTINDLQVGTGWIAERFDNVVNGTNLTSNNYAILTLPTPGQANPGSLGYNNNVIVQLDVIAPAAPTLTLLNDNGADPTDGISNDSTVQVGFLDSSSTLLRWQPYINGVAYGPVNNGTVSTFVLPVGSYPAGSVTVRQWDPSGNPSPLGANTQLWTFEQTPPAQLTASYVDTGISASDGITRNGTITVGGMEPNARLIVRVINPATGAVLQEVGQAPLGVSSFTIPTDTTFAQGALVVLQEDVAGNPSIPTVVNPTSPLVIDRAIPAPVIGPLSSTDHVTLPITSLERNAAVRVTVNGVVVYDVASYDSTTTAPVNAISTQVLNIVLEPGLYAAGTIVVTSTDLAGNTVTSSNATDVDAGIYAIGVGFGRTAASAVTRSGVGGAVTVMTIRFNRPVNNFNLSGTPTAVPVRLLWNGRTVSLRTARMVGSGPSDFRTEYRLVLPATLTNRRGNYVIEVDGAARGIRSQSGVAMSKPSLIYWRRV
jgi:hypothetical protein